MLLFWQKNEDKIAEVYQPIRRSVKQTTQVGVPEILAARDGEPIFFCAISLFILL